MKTTLTSLFASFGRTLLSMKRSFRQWEYKPLDPTGGVLVDNKSFLDALYAWADANKLPPIGVLWTFYLYTCLVKSGRYGIDEADGSVVLAEKFKGADMFVLERDVLMETGAFGSIINMIQDTQKLLEEETLH